MSDFSKYLGFLILLAACRLITVVSHADPSEKEVLAAMKKASEFMVNEVSLSCPAIEGDDHHDSFFYELFGLKKLSVIFYIQL